MWVKAAGIHVALTSTVQKVVSNCPQKCTTQLITKFTRYLTWKRGWIHIRIILVQSANRHVRFQICDALNMGILTTPWWPNMTFCSALSLDKLILSSILTRTLNIEKMYARNMLIVFLTFASFASVHVSLTHVTGPPTWTLKQVFLNSIQLTWTFIVRFLGFLPRPC